MAGGRGRRHLQEPKEEIVLPKCVDCKKEQPVLTSIYRGAPGGYGEALCDECLKLPENKKQEAKKDVQN